MSSYVRRKAEDTNSFCSIFTVDIFRYSYSVQNISIFLKTFQLAFQERRTFNKRTHNPYRQCQSTLRVTLNKMHEK